MHDPADTPGRRCGLASWSLPAVVEPPQSSARPWRQATRPSVRSPRCPTAAAPSRERRRRRALVGRHVSAVPSPSAPERADLLVRAIPVDDRPRSRSEKKGHCNDIVIEGRTFKDLGPGVEAIHLERCKNVTIRANDFARVAQAITVIDSTNVRIEWNRYLDILGPHKRVPGKHRANFVAARRGPAWPRSAHNKGKGGDTEDIISLFRTGGTAKHPFIIEYNHFQGGDWTSTSGSGIALGDATSSHSIARYNVLLDPGQAGIFIAGGTDHKIIGNTILGRKRKSSNVGIYVWSQSDAPCGNNTVRDNRVSWTKGDGSAEPELGWRQLRLDQGLEGQPMACQARPGRPRGVALTPSERPTIAGAR